MKKHELTLNNHLIILAFNAPIKSGCDYALQTLQILARNNHVFGLSLGEPVTWKDLLLLKAKPLISRYGRALVLRPFFLLPGQRNSTLKALNYRLFAWAVSLTVRARFLKLKKIFWFFEPFHIPMLLPFFKDFTTLYDCFDYFPGFSRSAKRAERNLLRQVDFCFAHSPVLAKKLAAARPDVISLPAGFAQSLFQKKHPFWRRRASGTTFTVGYVGGIDIRLDFTLLFRVAKSLPDVTFRLVGPVDPNVFGRQDDLEPQLNIATRLPNVHLEPAVPKQNIPQVIAAFDTCIIPYDLALDFNRFCFPMKLYEYFYLGKPVVATPIEALKPLRHLVNLADTSQGFVDHLTKIQNIGWSPMKQRQQRAMALKNSWDKRLRLIARHLSQTASGAR